MRVYHRDTYVSTATDFRFNGPRFRFDHQRGDIATPSDDPDRGVVYLGENLRTCAIETFVRSTAPHYPDEVLVCPRWTVGVVAPYDDVFVQDLTGEGATDLTALQSLCSGDVHRTCSQEWARAIYDGATAPQGIKYAGYKGGGMALAIFERSPTLGLMGGETALREDPVWTMVTTMLTRLNVMAVEVDSTSCTRCRDNGVIDPATYVAHGF